VDGRVSILDADGDVVAREGDLVQTGGGPGLADPDSDCLRGAAEVFAMEAVPVRVR
jgi:hypothetical protein